MHWNFISGIFMIVTFISTFSKCFCEICVDKPDGVYETNCRAYSICIGGKEEIVNCEIGQAFNTKTKQCESKWDVPPPCGTYRECTDKEDGFYPDVELQCKSYYVCNNGLFVGHSLCPADLVYNVNQGVCDYNYSAPPPCGTNATALVDKTALG